MNMGHVFAVAGKGGVGKTTISALFLSYLAKRSGNIVLGVDADPNYNLGDRLGIDVQKTIGDVREEFQKSADEASEISKQAKVAYYLQTSTEEGPNFDLITMGRPEGKGCYCYINSILRDYLDEAIGKYSNVVIDNEAGMEHLSRLTCKNMDALMIVTDATAVGLKTAKRILDLALSLDIDIRITALVINRIPEGMKIENVPEGFSAVYYIPFDEKINKLTTEGKTLELESDNPAYKAVKEMTDDLLMRCKER